MPEQSINIDLNYLELPDSCSDTPAAAPPFTLSTRVFFIALIKYFYLLTLRQGVYLSMNEAEIRISAYMPTNAKPRRPKNETAIHSQVKDLVAIEKVKMPANK